MKWKEIRDTILNVVAQCAGAHTCWRDQPQDFVVPPMPQNGPQEDYGVTVKLHALATNSLGRDDFRQAYNSTTNKIEVTQYGNRTFTITAMAESFDQIENFSLLYTERIRSAMQRPQVLDMFRAIKLTVTGVNASVDVSYYLDGRQVSAASVDIDFAYANVVDRSSGEFGLSDLDWIEFVQGLNGGPITANIE